MSRTPWTKEELADIELGWPHFHELWPHRSYDSWEVKRRRVGASAGQSRRKYGRRKADQLAERILKVIEAYLAEERRG